MLGEMTQVVFWSDFTRNLGLLFVIQMQKLGPSLLLQHSRKIES